MTDKDFNELMFSNNLDAIKLYFKAESKILINLDPFTFKWLAQQNYNDILCFYDEYFKLKNEKGIIVDILSSAVEFSRSDVFYCFFNKYSKILNKKDIAEIFKQTSFLNRDKIDIFNVLFDFFEYDYLLYGDKNSNLIMHIMMKNSYFFIKIINSNSFKEYMDINEFIKKYVTKQSDIDFVNSVLKIDNF